MNVWNELQVERARQIAKGSTAEHDDCHRDGALVHVATDILLSKYDRWGILFRTKGDRRRQLVVAASLVVAEIERLDRTNADEAMTMLCEVYRHVGNGASADQRHTLPPGLRDRIRDYIVAHGHVPEQTMKEKGGDQ